MTRACVCCVANACKERHQAAIVAAPGSIRLQLLGRDQRGQAPAHLREGQRWGVAAPEAPDAYSPSHSRLVRVLAARKYLVKLHGLRRGQCSGSRHFGRSDCEHGAQIGGAIQPGRTRLPRRRYSSEMREVRISRTR